MKYEQELEIFKELTEQMYNVFAAKRHDYGPTSEYTFKKFGLMSMVIRMSDKLGRLENIALKNDILVTDEKAEDTLLDLANYALITILEMKKIELESTHEVREYDCERRGVYSEPNERCDLVESSDKARRG